MKLLMLAASTPSGITTPLAISTAEALPDPRHPPRRDAPRDPDDDEDRERGREGVAERLADVLAEPGVQQLERVVRVLGVTGPQGVVADAGDEQHPAGEPDHLHRRRGDPDAGDPPTQAAAGRASEEDPDRAEQAGADRQDEEPADDRCLVAPEGGEDLGGRLVEDGGIVEDRAERGEPGDGEGGGAGHRDGCGSPCGLGVHGHVLSR